MQYKGNFNVMLNAVEADDPLWTFVDVTAYYNVVIHDEGLNRFAQAIAVNTRRISCWALRSMATQRAMQIQRSARLSNVVDPSVRFSCSPVLIKPRGCIPMEAIWSKKTRELFVLRALVICDLWSPILSATGWYQSLQLEFFHSGLFGGEWSQRSSLPVWITRSATLSCFSTRLTRNLSCSSIQWCPNAGKPPKD